MCEGLQLEVKSLLILRDHNYERVTFCIYSNTGPIYIQQQAWENTQFFFTVLLSQDKKKIFSQIFTIPDSGDNGYCSSQFMARVPPRSCPLLLNTLIFSCPPERVGFSMFCIFTTSPIISELKAKLVLSSKAAQHSVKLDVI